jgi:hypothetical protein
VSTLVPLPSAHCEYSSTPLPSAANTRKHYTPAAAQQPPSLLSLRTLAREDSESSRLRSTPRAPRQRPPACANACAVRELRAHGVDASDALHRPVAAARGAVARALPRRVLSSGGGPVVAATVGTFFPSIAMVGALIPMSASLPRSCASVRALTARVPDRMRRGVFAYECVRASVRACVSLCACVRVRPRMTLRACMRAQSLTRLHVCATARARARMHRLEDGAGPRMPLGPHGAPPHRVGCVGRY